MANLQYLRMGTTLLVPLLLAGGATGAELAPADAWRAEEAAAVVRYDAPAEPAATKDEPPFAQRLTSLELALSTIVTQTPSLWRLAPLEAEAIKLLHDAPSEADRLVVRQLADRIGRFASIADRYRTPPLKASTEERLAPPVAEASKKPPTTKRSAEDPRYDATGVLRPVVSQRPNAPKFALVDDHGNVTTFVSPTKEVDLKPMLGKRLGIRGSRGFIPEYQREHVTAERVATLDRVVR